MIEIAVAAIGAIATIAGVIISNNRNNAKMQSKIETAQAVTDCKIDELTREVREHNNFAKRMPVVEYEIKVANHRIADLEAMMKNN